MERDSASHPLVLVQVLRAAAATLVLLGHTFAVIRSELLLRGPKPWVPDFPGGFGVDLFFAISGLIMVLSSGMLYARSGATYEFLTRRVIRLVPLYWIVTLAYVPVLLMGSHGYNGSLMRSVATSLSFFPYPTYGIDESRNVYPLYTLGWTLNYEVFFYFLFSLFVTLPRRRATVGVAITLVSIVALGFTTSPVAVETRFWSRPIILEFAFGLLIATLWLSQLRMSWRICSILALAAVALLWADPLHLAVKVEGHSTPNEFNRVLGWGVPAALLLTAAVFLEKRHRFNGWIVSSLALVGDSSYALYLVHPMALLAVTWLWRHLHLGQAVGFLVFTMVVLTVSYSLAILVHLVMERPLTRKLHAYSARATSLVPRQPRVPAKGKMPHIS